MDVWTDNNAEQCVNEYTALSPQQKKSLLDQLNTRFPPSRYHRERACLIKAMNNAEESKQILAHGVQRFPRCIESDDCPASKADLASAAIILTAGGDGERLRVSLKRQGIADEGLENFTKATYQVPGLPSGFGTLQANCAVIARLCRDAGTRIPVIITTGPEGSATHRVISGMLEAIQSSGLTNIRILAQDERLHLTPDGLIVYAIRDGMPCPVTNPDETGGPFMKLKRKGFSDSGSALDWISDLGCTKIIALQATALYDPAVIRAMAASGRQNDCLGVGVLRTSFDEKDPFGTFVALEKDGKESLVIVEQAVRNSTTMTLKDRTGVFYLPFNTGLYVFDTELLNGNNLPDYATPPKEILPSIPRSPKAGYAATDLVALARRPAVLAIKPDSYGVLKTADDLFKLSLLAKRYGIAAMCAQI